MAIEIRRDDKKKASPAFMAGYNDGMGGLNRQADYGGAALVEYANGQAKAQAIKAQKAKDTPPKPKIRTRAPNGTFNRTEYQRLYMQAKREMKMAGVEGVTVKEWRDSKR
jgi:hypothetical protein